MIHEAHIKRYIQDEIKRQLFIVLTGTTKTNTVDTEDVAELVSEMDTAKELPIAHPFGFVSRAPSGTFSVTIRTGPHHGSRMVFSHRDKDKPEIDSGDACLYAKGLITSGKLVRVSSSKVHLGNLSASNPIVLGTELQTYLGQVHTALSAIIDVLIGGAHVITTVPGNPTAPEPGSAATFTAQKAALLAAQAVFVTSPATNIFSQSVFAERGLPV